MELRHNDCLQRIPRTLRNVLLHSFIRREAIFSPKAFRCTLLDAADCGAHVSVASGQRLVMAQLGLDGPKESALPIVAEQGLAQPLRWRGTREACDEVATVAVHTKQRVGCHPK